MLDREIDPTGAYDKQYAMAGGAHPQIEQWTGLFEAKESAGETSDSSSDDSSISEMRGGIADTYIHARLKEYLQNLQNRVSPQPLNNHIRCRGDWWQRMRAHFSRIDVQAVAAEVSDISAAAAAQHARNRRGAAVAAERGDIRRAEELSCERIDEPSGMKARIRMPRANGRSVAGRLARRRMHGSSSAHAAHAAVSQKLRIRRGGGVAGRTADGGPQLPDRDDYA